MTAYFSHKIKTLQALLFTFCQILNVITSTFMFIPYIGKAHREITLELC